MYGLLNRINSAAALRQLTLKDLHKLSKELRDFVIESVSRTGGHFSSNLGAIELTIALHYVFDTPHDRIVWDVGHQTYAHKILTGRREQLSTLRQLGGLSGFPRRCESPFDTFGTAHSSTALSASLGMAVAAKQQGIERHSIAVVGDGAMSAGMAYEAMNNLGSLDDIRLLVVLNDNNMSISPSVGSLARYLEEINGGKYYSYARKHWEQLHRESMASAQAPLAATSAGHTTTIFENLGLKYRGPIDGHNIDAMIEAFRELKRTTRPHMLHVVTEKGHGYAPAEVAPVQYHGPGRFDPAEGIKPSKSTEITYTQVFSDWICDEAEQSNRIVAITPGMREGSGLVEFAQRFPSRYFDVGIAEQHAVTFAAGLATEGLRPVVAIYSTFLQRGYDQLIHDVAIQNLPVVFAIDRAGIVGADGATHMGAFDLAYLRCLPNMVVMAPADEDECRQMLHTAVMHNGQRPLDIHAEPDSGPQRPRT